MAFLCEPLCIFSVYLCVVSHKRPLLDHKILFAWKQHHEQKEYTFLDDICSLFGKYTVGKLPDSE